MKFHAGALLGIAAAALLAACDSDSGNGGPAPVPPNQETTSVRFIHAVPDAPDVDIRAANALVAFALDFAEATRFLDIRTGTASVRVDANVPGGAATVIGPVDVALAADMDYTIIATGEVDPMGEPVAPLVIANPDEAVSAGNARVEVVHAAPNAPAVDVYVTVPGAALAGEAPVAGGGTPFGANSGPLEVPAGDYQIRVTLPGSTTPVFDSGTVTLAERADLLITAIDNTGPGDSPIKLLVHPGGDEFEILDASTPAEVRVVHAVPDAPPVDIYVDDPTAAGAPAIAGLDYGQTAPGADSYVALAGGTTSVLVTAAGNPGVIAIPAADLTLAAGQQYTVYATGTLASGIVPYVTADDDRSIATEARVRILHLSPSAGPVDIYITAPMTDIADVSPTFSGVALRQETGYVSLAGGSYDVTVTVAGTKTAAIGPATVTLSDGGVYTAAARDPDPDVAGDTLGLILLDDF